jgi:hypothetical protein
MDGAFYWDTRTPFISGDVAAVTLASTDKALYPAANFPVLGANYFGFIGKKLYIRLFGRMTTGATPGNGTLDVYWGTGADANGTIIGSSAAVALVANGTNLTWQLELWIHCRAIGASGSLLVTGTPMYALGLMLSTVQPQMIPASAPAPVTVDLTAANIISVQYKRSGSTAETMQVHDMIVAPQN